MMPVLPTAAVLLLVLLGVACLGAYCIRRIPLAYAWNPDSHDKITSYSLALLKNDNRTLLGWALNEADAGDYRKENVVLQLRRGSVDEDMSSDVFSGIERLSSWFRTVETLLATIPYTRPIGYIMLAARYGGKHYFKAMDSTQLVEGTNGGYHFYNPSSGVGLSEKTFYAEVLKKLADCVTRPMPTALARATDPSFTNKTASPWCFDLEKRNYTTNDANDYFSRGYYHVSFYSMGRVLHLLQDMTVPAHVRDDSHFGIGRDFSEPLEYYADLHDYISRTPNEGLAASNEERWKYRAESEYEVSTQPNHLSGAAELFPTVFQNYKGMSADAFFRGLARKTHGTQFSAGTIPGNADSHDPDDTDIAPWITSYPPDFFKKCRPNVDSLIDLLRFCQSQLRNVVSYMNSTPGLSNRISSSSPDSCVLADDPTSADIIRFLECLAPLVQAIPVDELNPDRRDIWNQGQDPTVRSGTPDIPKADRRNIYVMSVNLRERLEVLTPLQNVLSSRPGLSVVEMMKEWIAGYPDRKRMTEAFYGYHGPCCMVNDTEKPLDLTTYTIREDDCNAVLKEQYETTEVDAIAYSAAFLANWFESLYAPDTKRGIGCWVNGNARKVTQVPDPDEEAGNRVLEQEDEYAWPKDRSVGSIGIVNHLPLEMDIAVEFSLSGVTEEDMKAFPDGIRINGSYGHFVPEADSPVQELSEIALTQGVRKEWLLKGCRPFNTFGQAKVGCPLENVSYTGDVPMGGIKRDQVETALKAISTYPQVTPDTSAISEGTLALPTRGVFVKMNSTLLVLELNMGKADEAK